MSIDNADGTRLSPDVKTASAGTAGANVSLAVHVAGAWTIVAVSGEMDLLVVPLLGELVSADVRHVVFELRQVTFIDGRGIDLLLERQRDALRTGGCVRLVAPSRQVRRLLIVTGLSREFTMFETVDEAVSAPVPTTRAVAAARRILEAP